MKRREFLGSLAIGGVASTLAQCSAAEPGTKLLQSPLVLMAPRSDGVEAIWAINRLSVGRVEWESESGEEGVAATDQFGFVPQGEQLLRVRLAGLEAGRKYRVRAVATAGNEVQRTEWKEFRTLDPRAGQTRFVMWNDTHANDETIRALHGATPAADFLVWNGDTCNDWKAEALLVPTLLNPGGCDVSAQRPMFINWGNHDVRGPYAFKMSALVGTPEGRPFCAFRSGPVACICLHTGEDKPDDHPSFGGRVAFEQLRREQAQWLTEVIRREEFRTAPYRVVFCHIPLRWIDESTQDYANGGYDRHSGRSRAAWHDSLVAWKTQVVLSGHTHRPMWLPPTDAFPYGQLTGGGPKRDQATWLECSADSKQLELKLNNLDGNTLQQVTFEPVT